MILCYYRTRANRVPGGTIFQTVAAGGHYSRGGTIQEGALLFQSPTKQSKSNFFFFFNSSQQIEKQLNSNTRYPVGARKWKTK